MRQGASPIRPGLAAQRMSPGGNAMMVRGQQRVVARGRASNMVTAGRGQVRSLGQPGTVVSMGRGQVVRGRGVARGQIIQNQRIMAHGTPPKTRGGVIMATGRGQAIRGQVMGRGNVQIRGQTRGGHVMTRGGGMMTRPRLAQPMTVTPQARRGRPPSNNTMMINQHQVQVQPQAQPKPRTIFQNQPRKIAPQPRPSSPTNSMVSAVSSWHTPSQNNRPVSPPKTNDSFKIKLPKMSSGPKVKSETIVDLDDDIISIEPPAKTMRVGTNAADALSNRPGLQISRGPSNTTSVSQEEGVDPLSLDDVSLNKFKRELPCRKKSRMRIF